MSGPEPRARRRPWGPVVGIVLVLPQVVLAFLVVGNAIVTGLVGFAFTIGMIRLAAVGYRVLERRHPWTARAARFLLGAAALVVGALLYAAVAQTARAMADPGYAGVVAPPSVIALNLVLLATLALWIAGAAVAVGSLIGLITRPRS